MLGGRHLAESDSEVVGVIKGVHQILVWTTLVTEQMKSQVRNIRKGWISCNLGKPSRIAWNFSQNVSWVYLTFRV
jgi:hypothetical protein